MSKKLVPAIKDGIVQTATAFVATSEIPLASRTAPRGSKIMVSLFQRTNVRTGLLSRRRSRTAIV